MKVTEVVQEKHDRGLSYKVAVGGIDLGPRNRSTFGEEIYKHSLYP